MNLRTSGLIASSVRREDRLAEMAATAPPPPGRFADVLPTDHLLVFLVTVYILILIPGPSVLFVISRGVARGRRSALATAVGNEIGLAVQLALVAAGVGPILARSDAVYTTVKLIGAAYLVVLGIRSIRDRRDLAAALHSASGAARSFTRTLREGFVVGVSNPKGRADLHRRAAAIHRSFPRPGDAAIDLAGARLRARGTAV